MELLLVSYLAGTKTITANYLSKLSSKTITFIPTAGNVEPYTGFIDEGIAMLEDLGYQLHLLDIVKVEEPVLIQELESAACVCISGGNTFYLLQELKKKHLTELLARRIREGMFYIGESAGAIIAAPDIELWTTKPLRPTSRIIRPCLYLTTPFFRIWENFPSRQAPVKPWNATETH